MKHILIILLLLLGAMGASAQTTGAEKSKEEIYKAMVRQQLALDYSMPDYSTSSINAKVMAPRLRRCWSISVTTISSSVISMQ